MPLGIKNHQKWNIIEKVMPPPPNVEMLKPFFLNHQMFKG